MQSNLLVEGCVSVLFLINRNGVDVSLEIPVNGGEVFLSEIVDTLERFSSIPWGVNLMDHEEVEYTDDYVLRVVVRDSGVPRAQPLPQAPHDGRNTQ